MSSFYQVWNYGVEMGLIYAVPFLFVLVFIVTYAYYSGRSLNPVTWIIDYREDKRLDEAARLGLTWEQYKEKYHIK